MPIGSLQYQTPVLLQQVGSPLGALSNLARHDILIPNQTSRTQFVIGDQIVGTMPEVMAIGRICEELVRVFTSWFCSASTDEACGASGGEGDDGLEKHFLELHVSIGRVSLSHGPSLRWGEPTAAEKIFESRSTKLC